MPRVLLVTATDPVGVVGGGNTATRSIISGLTAAPIGASVELEILRPRPTGLPRSARQGLALLRSLLSPLPSKALFDLPFGALARVRHKVAQGNYDWVFLNGVDTYALAPALPAGQPTILIVQNVEAELFRSQIERRRLPRILRALLAQDLRKLERLEQAAVVRSGRIICLSGADAAVLGNGKEGIEVLVMPTAFSYPSFVRRQDRVARRPLRLSFLAKYHWWPNVAAVEWLCDNVLVSLPPDSVRVQLFGPGAERFAGRHPLLVAKGYTEDLAQVWDETDIFICPMVSGSGINIKFLEAIYNRQPVLATPFTQRGIEPINDPSVLFLAGAEQWAEFLASDEALALAARVPRAETAARFAQTTASAALASFLDTAC